MGRTFAMTFSFRFLWILLLTASGLAAQSRLETLPLMPKPCPENWLGFIGKYSNGRDTLLVAERDGKIILETNVDEAYTLVMNDNAFELRPREFLGHRLGEFERTNSAVSAMRFGKQEFLRILTGGEEGKTFRIESIRNADELRVQALADSPPQEVGRSAHPELTELTALDSTIRLDIRYASSNNFMSTPFYSQARAFLQRPAAEALLRAHKSLRRFGYGLLIHDAYRPWYVTKMFWEATPPAQRVFVADPAKGSRHNRGCAVDLTLYDLATGKPIEMPSGYDEFSERAYPYYPGGTSLQRWHRELLRAVMENQGFAVYEFEWWHFDYKDWQSYPIMNVTFDRIR